MSPAATLSVEAGSRACSDPGVHVGRAFSLAVRRAIPHLPQAHRNAHPMHSRRAASNLPSVRRRHHLLYV